MHERKISAKEETKTKRRETKMTRMKFRVTLTEPMLGMTPNNEEIYTEFIGSKAPDAPRLEEEVASLGADGVVEKGMTVFPRTEDGQPFVFDYQMKGFFKDTCGMLNRLSEKDPETGRKKKATNESGKLTAYKKVIDGLIFTFPRQIVIQMPEGGEITYCQRPLRAQTAQGERIALAISEQVPAGSVLEFEVLCLDDAHIAAVLEWLDYGQLRGLGQWRNSGCGRFNYEVVEEE